MAPSLLSFCVDMAAVALYVMYTACMILTIGVFPLRWAEQAALILSMPFVFVFCLALAVVVGKARLHGIRKTSVLFDCAGYEWLQLGTILGVGWIVLLFILPREVPTLQYVLMLFPVVGWFAWSVVFMLLFPLLYIITDEGLWIRSWGAFYVVPFSEVGTVRFLPEPRFMFPTPGTRPITRCNSFVFIEYGIGRKMARRLRQKYLTPSNPALFMEVLSAHMARRAEEV